MATWKHFIVLFGGFYDPGIRTKYLSDLWVFDTQEFKWHEISSKQADLGRWPSPRSGFSFLPVPEGVVLHGGYCKEYIKGKHAKGVPLDDTWLLQMDSELSLIKWARRKKIGYAPSLRSGSTMAYWANKSTGVMFGGVCDEEKDEESIESVFYNDMYGYQTMGSGRWISITLRKQKKKAEGNKRVDLARIRSLEEANSDEEEGTLEAHRPKTTVAEPEATVPLVRYNAMLAILRNTLYIYGGIFERGSREYTLDDFYALPLDKLDRFICLKESGVVVGEGADESSDDSEDDSDDDDEEDEDSEDSGDEREGNRADMEDTGEKVSEPPQIPTEERPSEQDELRTRATEFMGRSKDATRTAEDILSTPLPGETLAVFYARSRQYWAQKAHETSDNKGKLLRRDGFSLAEERYASYKGVLEEVERILAEAGLDEEEIKRTGGGIPDIGTSRNRR